MQIVPEMSFDIVGYQLWLHSTNGRRFYRCGPSHSEKVLTASCFWDPYNTAAGGGIRPVHSTLSLDYAFSTYALY